MYTIVGLGNPGEEYEHTRHNVGFMVLEELRESEKLPEFVLLKKHNAYVTDGLFEKEKVQLVLPQTYMNKSGGSVKTFVTSVKKAEKLIVVYDDIDLPFGSIKVSHGRGSGGHRGLESVIRAVKTKDFTRVRVGVTPVTPGGKLKKPRGEDAVQKFLLGDFSRSDTVVLKKILKRAAEAVTLVVSSGTTKAMNECN